MLQSFYLISILVTLQKKYQVIFYNKDNSSNKEILNFHKFNEDKKDYLNPNYHELIDIFTQNENNEINFLQKKEVKEIDNKPKLTELAKKANIINDILKELK